jgi:DNA end-binding protein Ku
MHRLGQSMLIHVRAIWKGSVSFGLVSVPVKAYTATEDHDVRFHQVHALDNGRIKYNRVCRECGNVLELAEISKAYQVPNGPLVILDEQDFASLPVSSSKDIEVVEFVPSSQVDPVRFDKAYLLEPEERALKPYVLLRRTLEDTDLTAIVKVGLRQKQQLGVLRVRENVLMLQTMLWPDEVRAAHFDVLDKDVEIRAQELSMAASLVESLAGDFDPDQYHDGYREQLLALIDAKVHGGHGVVAADEPNSSGGEVVDLLTALRESLARAGSAPTKKAPARKAPAKRAAATRTPAKKAVAKKPAAKKAPAKKAPAAKSTPAKKAPAKKTPAKKRARKTA